MSVTIKKVETQAERRAFVRFPVELYKGNPYYVPALYMDELETLNPAKNPYMDFCRFELFLAYKDGAIVGRVAAIINDIANRDWNTKEVRYGWFDFIDDLEVSRALLEAVSAYGREQGMTAIAGPLGFTDQDPEGMLVEGFDQIATFALRHNAPYYMKHMEVLGYEKVIDWLEFRITIPKEIPERVLRITELVKQRYGVHVRKVTMKEIKQEGLIYQVFDLINRTYKNLYGYTVLPQKAIEHVAKTFLSVLDLRFLTLVFDADNKLIGFGVAMASISKALQKCHGRLFPFGWFHILKSMKWKYEDSMELLLIAVEPEWANKGVTGLIFCDLIPIANKCGFKYAESNGELETNNKVQNVFSLFEREQNKRRRIYAKKL